MAILKNILRFNVLICLLVSFTGCSAIIEQLDSSAYAGSTVYRKSVTLPPLQVSPEFNSTAGQ